MRRSLALLAGLAATGISLPALAIDYLSVTAPALLYDAPSDKAVPKLIIKAGTPVEPLVSLDRFTKVREPKGGIFWVEKKLLSDKRTLLVRVDRAQIYKAAEDKAALAFEAERDVVLELAGAPANGWVPVRHRDGSSGFVRVQQIYGL